MNQKQTPDHPTHQPDSKAGDILTAAERLFCQRGYDGVSMNDVAREAGVSKANIFHHFGSKEDLYLEVIQNIRGSLTRQINAIAQVPSGVEHLLSQVARAELQHLFSHADQVRLFLRESLQPKPELGKALAEKVYGDNFAGLVASLKEAQQKGEIRADASTSFPVLIVVAACVFFFQHAEILRHLQGAEASATDPESFVRELVHLLSHGLLPPA